MSATQFQIYKVWNKLLRNREDATEEDMLEAVDVGVNYKPTDTNMCGLIDYVHRYFSRKKARWLTKQMVAAGADLNVTSESSGYYLINKHDGKRYFLKYLVDCGVNLNLQSGYDGVTPLGYEIAALSFSLSVESKFCQDIEKTVKLFIDGGADVAIKNRYDLDVLHGLCEQIREYRVGYYMVNVVKMLIEAEF